MFDNIKEYGRRAARFVRKTVTKCKTAIVGAGVGGTVAATSSNVMAQVDPPAEQVVDSLVSIIDPITLAYAVGALAGVGLLYSFTVGGGMRVAKKIYGYIFARI